MAHVEEEVRWLRVLAAGTVAAAGVVFWRGAADIFLLPKWTLIVLAALVGTGLLADIAIAERKLTRPSEPSSFAVIAFALGLVVATFAAPSIAGGIVGNEGREIGVGLYVACIALYGMARRAHRTGGASALPVAVTAAAALSALYAVLQVADLDPFDWGETKGTEVFSTMSNANFLAAWLAMALPFAAWGVLTSRGRRRQVWAASGVLIGFAMLATGSAQGPMAAVAGLLPIGVLQVRQLLSSGDPKNRQRLLAAAGVGVIAVAGGVAFLGGDVRDSMGTRVPKWDVGIEMVQEKPLTGYGFGEYVSWYRALRDPETAGSQRFLANADAPHDVHLDLFASGGMLLGAAHVAFVVCVGLVLLRGLRRSQGERRLLLAAIGGAWLAYQAQALVSIDVPPLAAAHWVLAGAIVGIESAPEAAAVSGRRGRGGSRGPRSRSRARSSEPLVTLPRVAITGVALVGAWFVVVPMRASLESKSAESASTPRDVIAAYDRAADLATWEVEYPNRKAFFLTNLGRNDDALEAMDEVLARDPRHFLSVSNHAKIAAQTGETEEALRWYERLLELDPHNPDVIERLAEFLTANDEEDRAIHLIEDALPDVRPRRRSRLQVVLASAYVAAGDEAEARDLLERVLERDPDDVEARALLDSL